RFPDHEWANSCASSDTRLLSPAMIVGEANVSRGFSIPPNGKLGGMTSTSYRPQRYGPYNFSHAFRNYSRSLYSWAALSTTASSANTPVRVACLPDSKSP